MKRELDNVSSICVNFNKLLNSITIKLYLKTNKLIRLQQLNKKESL